MRRNCILLNKSSHKRNSENSYFKFYMRQKNHSVLHALIKILVTSLQYILSYELGSLVVFAMIPCFFYCWYIYQYRLYPVLLFNLLFTPFYFHVIFIPHFFIVNKYIITPRRIFCTFCHDFVARRKL